jgi:ferredoxin
MPKKYHIHVHPTPNRFPAVGRSGIVDWGEGCLKCPTCVKKECVYGVYDKRTFSEDTLADTIDQFCKSCFRCVQGCPRRLIHKTMNPEWEALGDETYTPDIIAVNWEQAETGKIPVSGAGYGGPFSGVGFDSMWTDMSEIVRPTRDGIHGREYISTVVDVGRRPGRLTFDDKGTLLTEAAPSIRIPIPLIFDVLPFGDMSPAVWKAMADAAGALGTLMIVPQSEFAALADSSATLVPLLKRDNWDKELVASCSIVQIADSDGVFEQIDELKEIKPDLIVSVRIPADARAPQRASELARGGVEVIHAAANEKGFEPGTDDGLHVKDVIRDVNTALLSEGIRDEVTFLASGGIAMAEHVIKSMLCGANLVAVDVPLLIALECRVCRNCVLGGDCPVDIAGIDANWGAQRIVNMLGAWHNQLLEMMGAMGIREARRLRGEQGRVMHIEDLEADTFGTFFGKAGGE